MAFNVAELFGSIRIAGLAEAERGLNAVDRGFTAAGESAARAGGMVDESAAAFNANSRATTAATSSSARYRAAQLSAVAAAERYNALLSEENVSLGRLASAEAAVIRANERVAASTPTRPMQATAAAARATADEVTGVRTRMLGMLETAGKLGLMIGGFEIARKAFEFIGAGKDLTTSLNSVQAASQATDQQMRAVRAQAIGLGKDLTVPRATAVDAANAIDDLVRAGMTLPRAMGAARSALLLASAANTDMMLSSRVLGDTLDEFRLPASAAAKTASMLGAAATSTAGGLQTVFDALRYAGTRARAADIPLQDLLASIVDLSKAGLQGTNIGTGLAMAISKLASPSGAGAKALADLGIQAFDAQGKFKGLPYIIEQVFAAQKRMGSGSQQFLRDITVAFGARAANAIAGFAGKGVEGLDRFQKRLSSFDLQTAANNMNRGFSAAMGQITKQLTALGIDVYQKLEPALSGAAMWLGTSVPRAARVLGDILSPTAHIVGDVLGGAFHVLIGILGPVATALGHVGHFLADNSFGKGMATAVITLWAAFKGYTILRTVAVAVDTFFGRLAQRAVTAGAAVQTAMQRTVTSAGLAKTALGGLAAGVSFGMIARGASGATQAVSALGAAGVGAAQGFAIGGPWGAAVGGAVGLVSSLATSLLGASNASAKVNAEANTLTGTLNRQTGAITKLTVATQAHNLEQEGALEAAHQLGLSTHDVTLAALGNAVATRRVTDAYREYLAERQKILSQPMTEKSDAELGKLNDLIPAWGKVADSVSIGKSATDKAAASFHRVASAIAGGTSATGKSASATAQETAVRQKANTVLQWNIDAHGRLVQTEAKAGSSADNTAAAITRETIASGLLKNAMDALNGVNQSVEQTTDAFQQQLGNLRNKTALATDAAGKHVASLEQDTAAGAANRQTILSLIQGAQAHAQAIADETDKTHSRTQALKIGNAALKNDEDAIRAAAHAAGMNNGQIDAMIKGLGQLAKIHVKPKVDVDVQHALTEIGRVRNAITNLGGGNYTLSGGGSSQGASLGFAKGGTVPPNTTATIGERGWELLRTDSQGRAHIASHEHSRAITGLPARLPGYANGTGLMGYVTAAGFRGRNAEIMDAIVQAESGGRANAHNYNPATHDDSYGLAQLNLYGALRAPRMAAWHISNPSQLYNPALNLRIAHQMFMARGGFGDWSTYNSGAYLQFMGNDATVTGGSGGGAGGAISPTKVHGGWQVGTTVYTTKRAAENAARRLNSESAQQRRQEIRAQLTAGRHAMNAGNKLGNMLGRDLHVDKNGNLHGSTVSVGDIRSQLGALGKDLRDAGASKTFIDRIKNEGRAILDAARSRNKAAAEMQRAHAALVAARNKQHQDMVSFRSTARGIFDVASAGTDPVTGKVTKGSMLAQQRQAITRLREWFSGLHKVAHLIPPGYFRQLESQGPDALPQLRAILAMNPRQLRTFDKQAGEIADLTNRGAQFGSSVLDHHAVTVARQNEREWARRERRREHHLEQLFGNLENRLDGLKIAGKAEIDLKKGQLVFALERDRHHVAKQHRGRPTASTP